MADDNRLPTNQSQLDIKAELTAIKTAIQQLYAMQNKTDLTTIAPAENQIASATHAVDDIFTYNGKLYQVTSAIDIGDDITNKITEIATTSYVNPTRMNHIEDGIEANSTEITQSKINYLTEYVKSSSTTGGNYPTNKPFFVTIVDGVQNGAIVSAFIDNPQRLNRRIYLDSSHSVYFNKFGAFDMSTLNDDSVVYFYTIG